MDRSNVFSRIGAVLFVIWGVIHIVVGAAPLMSFFTSGPADMFAYAEVTVQATEMDATLSHLANIVAEYYFDIT